jgi:hypothetical protein
MSCCGRCKNWQTERCAKCIHGLEDNFEFEGY